ncbi:hypothetical protein BV20DRAFT_1025768 [Pilatotrama ljubarskyi]|nr:hypothetical protein BV20DRAFT_1025768 [Pilatotrama ljubarskyi]
MYSPTRSTRQWLLYSLFETITDALDTVLMVIVRLKRPEKSLLPSDVDGLSDEQLLELRKTAPVIDSIAGVVRLTPGTVAKPSKDLEEDPPDASEANALDLAFAKTMIPVPRDRRVINWEGGFLIVMDYIEGPTLAQAWPTLSKWRKLLVAFTLRRYIRQLRRLTQAPPGTPPGPLSTQVRICESPVFGQVQSSRGPFASYAEMSAFFNQCHHMALENEDVPQDDPARKDLFDDSEPLVLTHQDLKLRNIMMDRNGRIWLVDWTWAGYYPPWFEYATMTIQNERPVVSGTEDKFWQALIPFVCGTRYVRQLKWLTRMWGSFDYH